MNRKALTLMEIIVSLTILSITMVGLLNVFMSAKRHSFRSRSRVSAGELAKYFLDPLQMQVRQDQWNNTDNCIGPSATSGCPSAQTLGNMTYTPSYTGYNPLTNPNDGIINDVIGTTLRRVRVVIKWQTH